MSDRKTESIKFWKLKAQRKKSQVSRVKNKTKLALYKEPGIRIASDQKTMAHYHQNAQEKNYC